MSELLEVTGTVKGITEKPTGWTVIEVLGTGDQYTKKLDTKLPALIEAARAVGTGVATFKYTETVSDQTNSYGQPYKNRRLSAVLNSAVTPSAGPAGERATALTTPPQATPSQPPASQAQVVEAVEFAGGFPFVPSVLDKDRQIVRQTCIKAVGYLYQGTLSSDPLRPDINQAQVLHVLEAAAILERWVYRDGSAA